MAGAPAKGSNVVGRAVRRISGGRGRVAGRRAAVAGLLLAGTVAVVTASGWSVRPLNLSDGTAWLLRGGDLVHASASTGQADWMIEDVVDPEAADQSQVAQDGDMTVVVDRANEQAVSVDAVTLDVELETEAAPETIPYVASGEMYLVSDGLIRWMDPADLTDRATIEVPGTVKAAIDSDGILWAVTPRDGRLRKIQAGEVVNESRIAQPGHDMDITIAANQPVVLDHSSLELAFIDRRSGTAGEAYTLAQDGHLQGPSPFGTKAWIATDDRVLSVTPEGDASQTRTLGGRPHRPEVIDGRVIVPTTAGTLVTFDEETGREIPESPSNLEAATREDFSTFVQEGDVWFNSPSGQEAGTINANGEVQRVAVDEDDLRDRAEGQADPNEPLVPETVEPDREGPGEPDHSDPPSPPSPPSTQPNAPPTPTPPPSPPPVTAPPTVPPRPQPQPTTPSTQAPTTAAPTTEPTTTTSPDVLVPDVAGMAPNEACNTIASAGLQCGQAPTGEYNTPANRVLSQQPGAGSTAQRGSTVTITYHESEGVVVPAAGGRRETACSAIEQAGLVCNLVGQRSTTAVMPGEVLGQQPAEGARVGPGATVNVTYDSHTYGTLYRYKNPNTWELILSTSASGPAGWTRTALGVVFTEAAPGTLPLYCWEPNGTGTNQSNVYSTDPNRTDGAAYWRSCGTPVTAHVRPAAAEDGMLPVYEFVGFSEHYYSNDANDPVGVQNRDRDTVNPGWSNHAFNVYAE